MEITQDGQLTRGGMLSVTLFMLQNKTLLTRRATVRMKRLRAYLQELKAEYPELEPFTLQCRVDFANHGTCDSINKILTIAIPSLVFDSAAGVVDTLRHEAAHALATLHGCPHQLGIERMTEDGRNGHCDCWVEWAERLGVAVGVPGSPKAFKYGPDEILSMDD